MKSYLGFWADMIRCAFTGGRIYWAWIAFLWLVLGAGLISYAHHLIEGLAVTNMSDQVSWGIGICNFTFFVGVAAASVLLVVPAYFYGREDLKSVVLLSQLFSVAAVVMCLLFIVTDLGHPERFLHLVPFIGGRLNLPRSLLAWDVVVFNGQLLLSMHIPGYLLYMMYLGKHPKKIFYRPFIFLSVFWALVIHTVTAFLLLGLGSRAFWNTAILAPRFLVSEFASGPAVFILIFAAIDGFTKFKIKEGVFTYLRQVVMYTLPINLFLVIAEVFKEFYSDTVHSINAQYLYFGLHGHTMLTKFIWTANIANTIAMVIFWTPRWRERKPVLYAACALTILGIWNEKGMGLILPGFTPSPLGEIVEYFPNWGEILVNLGVVALGALMFTMMAKVAIAITLGELRAPQASHTKMRTL